MLILLKKNLLTPLQLCLAILLLTLTATEALAGCGGFGERACCLSERVPSCDSGLRETGAVLSFQCGGFPDGICGFSTPDNLDQCGGDGQRACCVGETEGFNSCDTGNIEVLDVDGGACPSPSWIVGASAGTCWEPTSCGNEGERACTIGDGLIAGESCAAGLIEIGGDRYQDPLVFGPSSGWCTKPSDCGGNGQRACCNAIGEYATGTVDACNGGLTKVPGVAGDSSCGIGNLVANPVSAGHSCVDEGKPYSDYPEPTTGWLGETEVEACDAISGKGYADLHAHMFGHLAHGGKVLAGKPYAVDVQGFDLGFNKALSKEDDLVLHGIHGLSGDALGFGTSDLKGSHNFEPVGGGNYGSPTFNTWPTWSSTTHQQMYYKWLERAWRGGLRLMVQFAVTNEALCLSTGADVDCADEMGPVDAQIDATFAFEKFIDDQHGGTGMGWFRIVTDPSDAQAIIDEGKLAVVLGIEVANLFDCKKDGCPVGEFEFAVLDEEGIEIPVLDEDDLKQFDDDGQVIIEMDTRPQTPEEYVQQQVDKYYDKGVRVIFPIHNFDNAFGGPATWQDAIHAGNAASENAWWTVEDCGDQGYGLELEPFLPWVLALISFDNLPEGPSLPPAVAHCNRNGLTSLGASTIKYMMTKGILVDVDHMSNKALDATLAIAEEQSRPVIASHVQFFDLNQPEVRHERMRTRAQLERIAELGGMIGAMLKDDQQEGNYGEGPVQYSSANGNTITNDCTHSSKTWAQMYQYGVDVMKGPVAMGSDFNGVAGHVGPRFGYDACAQDHVQRAKQGLANNRLAYPFELAGFGEFEAQKTGTRTFDFNNDGLAHVGLLPDMVADLSGIGISNAELAPLFNSAMGFVNVWKRVEGQDIPLPDINTALGCQDITVSANAVCESDLDVTIADGNTVDFMFPQTPDAPYALGTTAVILRAGGSDSCGNLLSSCTGTVTVVDDTPPTLYCPENIVAECKPVTQPAPVRPDEWPEELPWPYAAGDLRGTSVPFEPREIVKDNCAGAEFAGCSVAPGHPFGFGATPVSCSGFDAARNEGTCGFAVTIEDTTPPEITCPANIVAECTGNRSATVTPAMATGTDICAAVNLSTHDMASFPMGLTWLEYVATDEVELTASCSSNVVIEDTTPPVIESVTVSMPNLWPPNHKMNKVAVAVITSDRCDNSMPVCRINKISSSEDLNDTGDGNTAEDYGWDLTEVGATLNIELRSERDGSRDGRTYTVEVICADETGNTTLAETTVSVAKSKK
jgi:microsomal dipeptidase-like Zn-dependent dipeptidase